ncbi:MAG: 5-oxoprolinase subunit PxpA [Acidimicrobiales bacterium]|jgi:UPF0271 protein
MESRLTIDLNADLGETDGDLALMSVVTSANVACGGHAGDHRSMAEAVEAALVNAVVIGAHASYPDRAGFGRVDLDLRAVDVASSVAKQVTDLTEVALAHGATVAYLKLHGALYHRVGRDLECAEAILQELAEAGLGPLIVLAQPGAALMEAAGRLGWGEVEEGFCDRAYRAGGTLVDRREAGSVLEDTAAVVRQALSLAVDGGVRAADGAWVALRPGSLCLHGDTPGAITLARAIRHGLEHVGVAIKPFAGR